MDTEEMKAMAETYNLIPDAHDGLRGMLEGAFVHGVLESVISEVPIAIRRTNNGRIAVVQTFTEGDDRDESAGYGDTLAEAVKNWLQATIARNR